MRPARAPLKVFASAAASVRAAEVVSAVRTARACSANVLGHGGNFGFWICGVRCVRRLRREDRLRRVRGGILQGGAQVADGAAAFFGGVLRVQRAEVGEDGFVGGGGREAVGAGHGGVEIVVELAEDGDESVLVDHAFLRGEGGIFS